jgi:hypothetical protein
MAHKLRPATLSDLLNIALSGRKQRVLRLNPPYTLVQPEAYLTDLLRSQVPLKPQFSFVYTYVDRGGVQGYVQARCRWRRRDEWTITTLGSADKDPERIWEPLLEALVRAAGDEAVIRLFVKVAKDDSLIELFRKLGFTTYTNERMWGHLYFAPSGVPAEEPPYKPLRRHTSRDAWDLMQLYRAITPPAAQRAESLTAHQWQVSHMPRPWFLSQGLLQKSYVWPDQDKERQGLGGYVRLLTGARGHWVTIMFRHDAANRAICSTALDYVLWKAARFGTKPVYCAIREYQTEVEGLLEDRGFHLLTEQSLLVKYIAEPIKETQPALVPFLVPNKGELVATDFSGQVAFKIEN